MQSIEGMYHADFAQRDFLFHVFHAHGFFNAAQCEPIVEQANRQWTR